MIKKILVFCLAFILLGQVQPDAVPEEPIPIANETNLDAPSYRFTPFVLREKIYAINGFIKVNWFVAQQICAYQGLTLASINTAVEAENLMRFITEQRLTSRNEKFWISGTNLPEESTWVWFSNGRPLIYKNWASGEPNNAQGDERCLEMFDDGTWNDNSCDALNYFICENRCNLDSYSVPLYPNL